MRNKKLFLVIFELFAGSLAFSLSVKFNSVEEVCDYAIEHSEFYMSQKGILLLSLKNARMQISSFLPEFSFSWGQSEKVLVNSADSYSKSIELSFLQPLFYGGKNVFLYKKNCYEAYCEYENFCQSLENEKINIMRNVYEYFSIQKTLEVKNELLCSAKKQYEILKASYEKGLALETEVLEYSIHIIELEESLKEEERNLRRQKRSLEFALSLDENEGFELCFEPQYSKEFYIYFEPFCKTIWQLMKEKNITLKQKKGNLFYEKKALEFSSKTYVPLLSLGCSLSASSSCYPLTNPSFIIKLQMSFPDASFLPVNFSFASGFESKKNNSSSATAAASPTLNVNARNNFNVTKLSYLSSCCTVKNDEYEFYEQLLKTIEEHDACLEKIGLLEKTISLMEKQLAIDVYRVNAGILSHLDFLDEMQDFALKKIELLQTSCSLEALSLYLNMLSGFKKGGLENECKNAFE